MSRAAAPDAPPPPRPPEEQGVLLLHAGGRRLGVLLETVREVIPERSAQRLPGAPAAVVGITNVRGHVVTVLDLAGALGLPAAAADDPRVVLVAHRGRLLGLRVADAPRMLRIDPDALRPPGDGEPAAVYGVGEGEGGSFGMIDLDALLAPLFE